MSAARRLITPRDAKHGLYRWLTATVIPRPIAWVSTVSPQGVGNLAPHSFFTVASVDPAVVAFTSIGVKDTLRNILATGEFVINFSSADLMEQVNATSAPFPSEIDEAAALGIETESSDTVRPVRVSASPVAIEAQLHSTVGFGQSTMIFGAVTALSISEAVLDGDHPDAEALAPVSRLGRNEWGLPPAVRALDRPIS